MYTKIIEMKKASDGVFNGNGAGVLSGRRSANSYTWH